MVRVVAYWSIKPHDSALLTLVVPDLLASAWSVTNQPAGAAATTLRAGVVFIDRPGGTGKSGKPLSKKLKPEWSRLQRL
jgi:hypothetical protein